MSLTLKRNLEKRMIKSYDLQAGEEMLTHGIMGSVGNHKIFNYQCHMVWDQNAMNLLNAHKVSCHLYQCAMSDNTLPTDTVSKIC